jgi:ssDNA-binding Zn-finger/Zn-ribbon topoisomerase 1
MESVKRCPKCGLMMVHVKGLYEEFWRCINLSCLHEELIKEK